MVAVAILAAGRGTRMKSDLPKVLHTLAGRSLVERVIDSCQLLEPEHKIVIIGYQGAKIQQELSHLDELKFVTQSEQLGTGHAVQQLLPQLQDYQGDLLVLNGDAPLLRKVTLQQLVKTHQENGNAATLLTANLPNPQGYGRVFCDRNNLVSQIIEDRDCTPAQRKNSRVNAGIYCFNWPKLAQALPKLSTDNDQQEYYLTEVVDYLDQVMAVDAADYLEITGINDRKQLSNAYNILQNRIKDYWMKAGVMMIQPETITIDETAQLEPDVVIEPQTHIRGNSAIAAGSRIGPGSLINNSKIAENVTVLYSVVTDSEVAANTTIGPYAHLRGAAKIGTNCRIGNFVEIKKSSLGNDINAAHLSYLGDATLGDRVNIGAGTITANYDGVRKHQTIIGSGTKTGSNSVMVAPLTLGENVTVAAGSVVTKDVPPDALVIARARQKEISDWQKNI
ncbi:UDP-N-acetylglucosamine diphosphorylase/glucosamine-1-phosphate N-acetyltransferase [Xenococcus sp. PCC 7305]|uniref:bifunctional UDP-N-acetylglucosamine diphosphorylase/glucosamine-1-phosphate N-acetyltransferase GlmU n=1 Tax=Xenococcus sp. PCC 7305 TaxID=102125 RepID=UPI0002ACC0A3|nr:bifunctional UDP-N-acetylglucosamine diphosphorylase/glucosamine-1-phosphate N-acetyltransferase GlmU [Xenococcus sp. PCC 7305]ELS01736.1 UDP-N-acetylglucosamine diphosphorylase/glucosamine-1-phosphate N-acetyltransferase [Xenococcus sp. PCC 7305]